MYANSIERIRGGKGMGGGVVCGNKFMFMYFHVFISLIYVFIMYIHIVFGQWPMNKQT